MPLPYQRRTRTNERVVHAPTLRSISETITTGYYYDGESPLPWAGQNQGVMRPLPWTNRSFSSGLVRSPPPQAESVSRSPIRRQVTGGSPVLLTRQTVEPFQVASKHVRRMCHAALLLHRQPHEHYCRALLHDAVLQYLNKDPLLLLSELPG